MASISYCYHTPSFFVDPQLHENEALWAADAVKEGEVEKAEDWTPPWDEDQEVYCDGCYDVDMIHPGILENADYLSERFEARALRALRKEYPEAMVSVESELEECGSEYDTMGSLYVEPEEEWTGDDDWPGLAEVAAFVRSQETVWIDEAVADLKRRAKRKKLYGK
ncbi:MAG: hypothetical protein ABR602_02435 [Gemmatimonadales bacterium]